MGAPRAKIRLSKLLIAAHLERGMEALAGERIPGQGSVERTDAVP